MPSPNSPRNPPTTFHLVGSRIPPRRRLHLGGRAWATLILLIAAAGLVGASNLTVNQRTDTASLYAERFSVGDDFVLADSTIWVTKAARAAYGMLGSAVELSQAPPEARPLLAVDQWVYSVTLKEANAASVAAGGNYSVDLFIDETSVGRVFVSQESADPDVVESVRLSFPVGPELSTSSLYYVVVKPFVQTGPTIEYTIESVPPAGTNKWRMGGVENPDITATVGATVKLTGVNRDGAMHNLGIKDASGATLVGLTQMMEAEGDQLMVSFVPTSAGEYKYLCSLHATTMFGKLIVTSE